MSSNLSYNLRKAKTAKNDEFYTQLTDIEKECWHYKDHFRGKVIYCNCDDPKISNFFRYFSLKFRQLGLKKLIATCYRSSAPDLFSRHDCDTGLSLGYLGTKEPTGVPQKKDIQIYDLQGDGDFRSPECIELLKESDIVVTNPPFSLFRKFVAQLIEYDKKFLIIGHQNAITYKEIFALIKENKLWLGVDNGGTKWFEVNPDYNIQTESRKKIENGKKYFSMGSVVWFTNLTHKKQNEELILINKYDPEDYPKYDNYDAINIDKTIDIPKDYDGEMGVPITFLDKYNPNEFEIMALGIVGSICFTKDKKMEILDNLGKPTGKYTKNAKGTLYLKYDSKRDKKPAFKNHETGELYSSRYARIIIRKKEA